MSEQSGWNEQDHSWNWWTANHDKPVRIIPIASIHRNRILRIDTRKGTPSIQVNVSPAGRSIRVFKGNTELTDDP